VKKSGHLTDVFGHAECDLPVRRLRRISAGKDDANTILGQIRRDSATALPRTSDSPNAKCWRGATRSVPTLAAAMRGRWDEIEADGRRDQISFNYTL